MSAAAPMPTDDELYAWVDAYHRGMARGVRHPEFWRALIAAFPNAAMPGEPISTAPTDGSTILVYAPPREGLSEIVCECAYHPDAGWCVDELREVTRWFPTYRARKDAALLDELRRVREYLGALPRAARPFGADEQIERIDEALAMAVGA